MSSSPKIIVLKMREIIYTVLLLFLVVMLILCLILMFSGKQRDGSSQIGRTTESGQQMPESTVNASSRTAIYTAGVYTTPLSLGSSAVDVEVTVDSNHINSIRLVNLSETTAAAYPLVSPALDHLTSQILETQKLDGITCPQENRYTSQLLLSAISDALSRARIDQTNEAAAQ